MKYIFLMKKYGAAIWFLHVQLAVVLTAGIAERLH
jgi:hypothetical protein